MDKVKNLRLRLLGYLIPCFIACGTGIILIKVFLAFMMTSYLHNIEYKYMGYSTEAFRKTSDSLIYKFLEYGEYLLIPAWAVFCLWFAVSIFYRKEIMNPVITLRDASEKLLGGNLDFKVECDSDNELGVLCVSFEELRKNLYDSNYRLWKSLEERKRLNAAFSHDLRTPVTVLKGYTDLMEQTEENISSEKRKEIMSKISVQIRRLEKYVTRMSSLHKIEDIIPDIRRISPEELCSQLSDSGKIMCVDKNFEFSFSGDMKSEIYTDSEIVMQVFMNLVSNALRYAESKVECHAEFSGDTFKISVSDDGCGFSEEALRKAWQPFYRGGDDNNREHFGLGLYICRLLCRKTGGDIKLENSENGGGKVTAYFSAEMSEIR